MSLCSHVLAGVVMIIASLLLTLDLLAVVAASVRSSHAQGFSVAL